MKEFNLINESLINIPTFNNTNLNKAANDSDDRFWKTIRSANDPDEDVSKQTIEKLIKTAKDLYSGLAMLGGEYQDLAGNTNEIIKVLNKKSKEAISTEMSRADINMYRNLLMLIQALDAEYSSHRWYKDADVSVKAGYVPFRGTAKDPKVKYRFIVKCVEPLTQNGKSEIKRTSKLPVLVRDYIAGIEFAKNGQTFQILLTNTPGYIR